MPGQTPFPVYRSFQDLDQPAFEEYADQFVDGRLDGAERKQAFAKLAQVVAADESEIRASRDVVVKKHVDQKKRRRKLDALQAAYNFDFAKTSSIFEQQTITSADVLSACAQDGVEHLPDIG